MRKLRIEKVYSAATTLLNTYVSNAKNFCMQTVQKRSQWVPWIMEILGVNWDVQREHSMSQQPHSKPELKEIPDFRDRDVCSCCWVLEFSPCLIIKNTVIQSRATSKQYGRVQHQHWPSSCVLLSVPQQVRRFLSICLPCTFHGQMKTCFFPCCKQTSV